MPGGSVRLTLLTLGQTDAMLSYGRTASKHVHVHGAPVKRGSVCLLMQTDQGLQRRMGVQTDVWTDRLSSCGSGEGSLFGYRGRLWLKEWLNKKRCANATPAR
jgi:hypothetical protein